MRGRNNEHPNWNRYWIANSSTYSNHFVFTNWSDNQIRKNYVS